MVQVTTPPAAMPVALADVKASLKIVGTDSDTQLTSLIEAVTAKVEAFLGRGLITQTRKRTFDGFPDYFITEPFQTITAINYVDKDEVTQLLAATEYRVAPYRGIITCHNWPATYVGADVVEVEYIAGYGLAAADVPADIRLAIIEQVGVFFDKPKLKALRDEIKAMLEPYVARGLV